MNAIVSFALKKLDGFLTGEFCFLHGVKDDVEWIKNELKYMQAYLRDAETKQEGDERVRTWLSELRDIAYKTEDVIDNFNLQDEGGQTSTRGTFKAFTKETLGISRDADRIHSIGYQIKLLRQRVHDLSGRRVTYSINNISTPQEGTSGGTTNRLRELRMTTPFADEEHVVGFDDDFECLREKLLQREPRRTVISILGMGGLGKTTLARKLYNKNKDKFSRHAWICVSQEWQIRDLLKRIIKSIKDLTNDEFKRLEKMDDFDTERYLRPLLERRRYLMVFDDMWHAEVWENLKNVLPENHNGSRIIVTTRIKVVAELSDNRTYVHVLRFLRSEESWELFCKKAFPEKSDSCPQDKQMLGQKMVKKCGGLPLAIIVLGGLLSRKQYVDEWQAVKESIWRELKNKSIHISALLELSYKDLSHELQLCFLYFGLFPEDSEIDTEKLIRLWLAECLILDGKQGMDLEELAENYLK